MSFIKNSLSATRQSCLLLSLVMGLTTLHASPQDLNENAPKKSTTGAPSQNQVGFFSPVAKATFFANLLAWPAYYPFVQKSQVLRAQAIATCQLLDPLAAFMLTKNPDAIFNQQRFSPDTPKVVKNNFFGGLSNLATFAAVYPLVVQANESAVHHFEREFGRSPTGIERGGISFAIGASTALVATPWENLLLTRALDYPDTKKALNHIAERQDGSFYRGFATTALRNGSHGFVINYAVFEQNKIFGNYFPQLQQWDQECTKLTGLKGLISAPVESVFPALFSATVSTFTDFVMVGKIGFNMGAKRTIEVGTYAFGPKIFRTAFAPTLAARFIELSLLQVGIQNLSPYFAKRD